METEIYQAYVSVLKKELVPALGCTEPIAVAFAAAKAGELLGEFPLQMRVSCSGNIVKNVKSVTVPNSGGLKGIDAAAILGLVGGNADLALEVLSQVKEDDIRKTKELLKSDFCSVFLQENVDNLYINVQLRSENHRAEVTVSHRHTNISHAALDGEEIIDSCEETVAAESRDFLSVRGILEFADSVLSEDVQDVLDAQIRCNTAISDYGLETPVGAQVGRTLLKDGASDYRTLSKARAAAGSDARMSGCSLPVMINSGSGNQGLTVSLPVITYAEKFNCSREALYRALVISNLISIHIKRHIGSLSSFCGAVSASCGVGAAMTYLAGGTYAQICATISNTLLTAGGMVCDGAKPSCAAKIAAAVDSAVTAHEMSMSGCAFLDGEGLMQHDIEETIAAIGYVAAVGMKDTDVQILKIMTGEIKV